MPLSILFFIDFLPKIIKLVNKNEDKVVEALTTMERNEVWSVELTKEDFSLSSSEKFQCNNKFDINQLKVWTPLVRHDHPSFFSIFGIEHQGLSNNQFYPHRSWIAFQSASWFEFETSCTLKSVSIDVLASWKISIVKSWHNRKYPSHGE